MAETFLSRPWGGRCLYLTVALVLIFFRLLPLDSAAGMLPAPDLLLCVTCAWVLRRPDHVPSWLIVLVFLLCDLVFLRPPGLWTLLVLAVTEFLRARENLVRELPLPLEWGMVAVLLVMATLAESVILTIVIVPKVAIGVALLHTLMTVLFYPAAVAVLWLVFGIRRIAPGEVDGLGRRL